MPLVRRRRRMLLGILLPLTALGLFVVATNASVIAGGERGVRGSVDGLAAAPVAIVLGAAVKP
ncbi:MAG: hypothetical protein U0234_33620, partial [Sandaracinus sp.]